MARDPNEPLKIKQDGGSRSQSAFLWETVLLSPSRTDPMNLLLSYLATKTTQRLGVHFSTIKASNKLETDIKVKTANHKLKFRCQALSFGSKLTGFTSQRCDGDTRKARPPRTPLKISPLHTGRKQYRLSMYSTSRGKSFMLTSTKGWQ